jgi:transcriptional regulator with XRE-family HTH domain
MDLRSLLREMRSTAGLTQVQMADALNVGQSYISKLERGENFVDVLLFARWCQVCGIKPGKALDELLSMETCATGATSP